MAIYDKNGLLQRMVSKIRSAGIGGLTKALDVREFLTDLIDTLFSLTSGSSSGNQDLDWDTDDTYNLTDNKYAISRQRIFESKADDNQGNEPPYIPDAEGNYADEWWEEVSAAPRSAIQEYDPEGLYIDPDLTIVHEGGRLIRLDAPRPFHTADLETEITEGKWVVLTGGSGTGKVGTKPVDETNFAPGKILEAAPDGSKLIYVDKPSGGSGDTITQTFTEITASAITINPTRKIGNNYIFSVDGNRTFAVNFTGVPEAASGIIEIVKDNSATPRYIALPANSFVNENDYTEENDVGASAKTITGAANNGSGLIRITATAHGFTTGNRVNIQSVAGCVEANGKWTVTVIDANTFDLQGSTFVNTYTSGGTATKLANYLNIEQVANAVTIISFYCRNNKFYMNLRKGYAGF